MRKWFDNYLSVKALDEGPNGNWVVPDQRRRDRQARVLRNLQLKQLAVPGKRT